jgi:hypothetical protein
MVRFTKNFRNVFLQKFYLGGGNLLFFTGGKKVFVNSPGGTSCKGYPGNKKGGPFYKCFVYHALIVCSKMEQD